MKNPLIVRIKSLDKSHILLKLNELNINLLNINYTKEYIYFTTTKEDYNRLKKYLPTKEIEIIDTLGITKLKEILKKNTLFFLSIIFAIIIFLVLSHLTIKINIIHENKALRDLISEDLKEFGITPLSFKRSYQEYEEIITKIKNNHKDKIEWLEIEVEGMVLNIRVSERIIKDYSKDTKYCHIVANKSGIITKVLTEKGVSLVNTNDYVKKGDILISGEIKLNEEVKNDVCAEGKVYAEVWYDIKATYPLNYIDIKKTGKMRYNFMVKHYNEEYHILKSRVSEKETTK